MFFRIIAAGSSSEVMRISNDGRVGIGTVTPGQKLEINGNALANNYYVAATAGDGVGFWNSAPTAYGIMMSSSASYQYGEVTDYYIANIMTNGTSRGFVWSYGTSPSMALNANSGNLALKGTLSVNGAGNSYFIGNINSNQFISIGASSGIQVLSFNRNSATGAIYNSAKYAWSVVANNSADLQFSRYNGSGVLQGNSLALIDNGNVLLAPTIGSVGIGLTSPNTIFHIKGTNPILRIESNGSGQEVALNLDSHDNDCTSAIYFSRVEALTGYYGKIGWTGDSDGDCTFSTGGATVTEKMRLTNSGKLGIGTIDPAGKLHVYTNGTNIFRNEAAGTVGYNYLEMAREYNYRTNAIDFITNGVVEWGVGTLYNSGSGNSTFSISTDNTLASSKFVINTSGNVGIGLTNPGYKLDVFGDANISGHLYASVKHFRAADPTNPNHYITYSSLEGPENAVFYRGKVNIKDNIYIIKLPKEWGWLVDSDSLSVYLSSEDDDQHLSYSIYNDTIKIKNNKMLSKHIKCSYLIMATRKDIKPLEVYS